MRGAQSAERRVVDRDSGHGRRLPALHGAADRGVADRDRTGEDRSRIDSSRARAGLRGGALDRSGQGLGTRRDSVLTSACATMIDLSKLAEPGSIEETLLERIDLNRLP